MIIIIIKGDKQLKSKKKNIFKITAFLPKKQKEAHTFFTFLMRQFQQYSTQFCFPTWPKKGGIFPIYERKTVFFPLFLKFMKDICLIRFQLF